MFEAIHGSAPDIAGKDIANPAGLLHGAAMMLAHIGQPDKAELIINALLTAIEDGIHTADLQSKEYTRELVGTKAFTQAIIDRLGQEPKSLKSASYGSNEHVIDIKLREYTRPKKELIGVDIFLDWNESNRNPQVLGKIVEENTTEGLTLNMISNRGVNVYPEGLPNTFCTDHWRCRFIADGGHHSEIEYKTVVQLLESLNNAGLDCIKTENLYTFDGKNGYSDGQSD